LNTPRSHTWQDIQKRIRSNIEDRTWLPGDLIPGEVALAEHFGCARTTVNRALRELAATGVIDRKRKAGTRVAFSILENKMIVPPRLISETLKTNNKTKLLHLRAVHFADEIPFIYEDRWINTKTIKEVKNVDLSQTSANEWLVQNVPFTNGEFLVEANVASRTVAKALQLTKDESVLGSRRTTWLEDQSVTTVVSNDPYQCSIRTLGATQIRRTFRVCCRHTLVYCWPWYPAHRRCRGMADSVLSLHQSVGFFIYSHPPALR